MAGDAVQLLKFSSLFQCIQLVGTASGKKKKRTGHFFSLPDFGAASQLIERLVQAKKLKTINFRS